MDGATEWAMVGAVGGPVVALLGTFIRILVKRLDMRDDDYRRLKAEIADKLLQHDKEVAEHHMKIMTQHEGIMATLSRLNGRQPS